MPAFVSFCLGDSRFELRRTAESPFGVWKFALGLKAPVLLILTPPHLLTGLAALGKEPATALSMPTSIMASLPD